MAKNEDRKKLFKQRLPLYRKDPVLFCNEVTHFVPEPYQEKLLRDIASSPKVSIKSGHGIGKTATEANAALWFLSCFPFARVVATAPTAQQLHDVLWAEMNKWIARSPLLQEILNWTKTYVYVSGYERRWFAVAKTASKPENMQGFHEDNMLFIVDEASGVEDEIMEAILATLSGGNNKLLMCGNPTRTTGTFYDSFHKDRALYKTQTVSSLDSRRTNKENIAMFIRKYGEHSNVVKVRVFGEFPTQEDDVFIPLPLIERTVLNEIDLTNISKITLGVDVARYGDDETIIARNVGGSISIPVIRHGQNLMATVGDIVQMYWKSIEDYPAYKGVITAYIDDTGLGGGVTDRLEEVKRENRLHRLEIVPINFGGKPPAGEAEQRYQDIPTFMWATVRDMMESREISIENDEELVAQFSVRKYSINSNGKLQIESKKDMKGRGIKSPDRADAVALSCYTTDKVYDKFISDYESIVIDYDVLRTLPITKITIGVSTGSVVTGTSAVATAIIGDHKRAVVLASRRMPGAAETDKLGKQFAEFANEIRNKYKRIDYVYCDADRQLFLVKCIRSACEDAGLNVSVRTSANIELTNRILITTRLLAQNRLFITEDCESLSRAFSSAQWDDTKLSPVRKECTDSCTLNAFEYTIEREGVRFVD